MYIPIMYMYMYSTIDAIDFRAIYEIIGLHTPKEQDIEILQDKVSISGTHMQFFISVIGTN